MDDTPAGVVEDPVETQRKRFKHDLTGSGKVTRHNVPPRQQFIITTTDRCPDALGSFLGSARGA